MTHSALRALSDALLIAGVALILAAGCEVRYHSESRPADCAPVVRTMEGGQP